jgi:hypothetical protein
LHSQDFAQDCRFGAPPGLEAAAFGARLSSNHPTSDVTFLARETYRWQVDGLCLFDAFFGERFQAGFTSVGVLQVPTYTWVTQSQQHLLKTIKAPPGAVTSGAAHYATHLKSPHILIEGNRIEAFNGFLSKTDLKVVNALQVSNPHVGYSGAPALAQSHQRASRSWHALGHLWRPTFCLTSKRPNRFKYA